MRRPPVEPSAKDTKNTKQKRSAPEGRPVPTMGMPARLYRLALRLNRPDLMPRVNKEEELKLKRDYAAQILLDLVEKVPALKIAFVQTKGGGATTTTTAHDVSMFGELTRTMVIAADFNPANGTLGSRLGRDYGTTIDLRQLADRAGNLGAFKEFIREARQTPYGVRVISASSIIERDRKIAGTDAKKILEIVNANSEYYFADTANDITTSVSLAIIEDCDVIVFTANVAEQDSLRQLATSMETLRRHGFDEKVNNSVVVISNIPKDRELDEFRKYLNVVNISNKVVGNQEPLFNGQFLGIPHDPVIAKATEVNLEALEWETFQAYLEQLIAVFEQAPQFKRRPIDSVVPRR